MNYVSCVVIVLFLPTLAAALMMIIAIYGIIQSSNAYGFTYTPIKNITQQQFNKYMQIKAIHDSGLPFPKYIHQISIGAGNPKNTSALTDYKAIQNYMQAIEKSISICDNKKYDYISASDQGFKNCMDMTAFAYETCSGDSSIYKSVCNNAIIEGILKTTNPSVQDLNDKAYKEAEVVLGHSTGNITTTNTQLKTYTDPLGFFTLQYPADWIVEYKQPATKFDTPKVTFITDHPILSIQISVKPSLVNTPEEFKDIISSMASGMTNLNPAWIIIDQGFGIYSIAGYDTYAFIYKDSNIQDPTSPLKGIMFVTRIGYQEMTILFATDPESFDQQMPILQKITDSIKITGR